MNNVKLWHTFGIIVGYFTLVAAVTYGVGLLDTYAVGWGVPFGVGIAVWIGAVVLFFLREKKSAFSIFPLPMSAIACGLCFGAFILGQHLTVDINDLVIMAAIVAACYLLLMLLLTFTPLKNRAWYEIVCFVLWLAASITGSIFACNAALPSMPERGIFLLFFLLLLGLLSVGSLIETDDFAELWTMLIVPAFIATGAIAVIVLLIVSEGDGCDSCDCGDCTDGCSCENGNHNGTTYTKKQKHSTTMQNLGNGTL